MSNEDLKEEIWNSDRGFVMISDYRLGVIIDICRDTATKAILSLPARNLTRQQALQVINKAFNDKGK